MNKFCEDLGVTRNDNGSTWPAWRTASASSLEDGADRIFGVLDPLEIEISNHPGGASR